MLERRISKLETELAIERRQEPAITLQMPDGTECVIRPIPSVIRDMMDLDDDEILRRLDRLEQAERVMGVDNINFEPTMEI